MRSTSNGHLHGKGALVLTYHIKSCTAVQPNCNPLYSYRVYAEVSYGHTQPPPGPITQSPVHTRRPLCVQTRRERTDTYLISMTARLSRTAATLDSNRLQDRFHRAAPAFRVLPSIMAMLLLSRRCSLSPEPGLGAGLWLSRRLLTLASLFLAAIFYFGCLAACPSLWVAWCDALPSLCLSLLV